MLSDYDISNSSANEKQLYSCAESLIEYGSRIYNMVDIYIITYYMDNIYVGRLGSNANTCKTKDEMCYSLHVVNDRYLLDHPNIIIVGESNLSERVRIEMENKVEFCGENGRAKLNADDDFYLYLSYLKLRDLNIHVLNSYNGNKGDDFITASYVKIININFTEDEGNVVIRPLFYLDGYVEMKDCSSTNIISNGYMGFYILVLVEDSKINSTTFEGCYYTYEKEKCGAVYLVAEKNNYFRGEGTNTEFKKCSGYMGGDIFIFSYFSLSFVIENICFWSGDDGNSATYGKNLFLICDYLEYVKDLNHFQT